MGELKRASESRRRLATVAGRKKVSAKGASGEGLQVLAALEREARFPYRYAAKFAPAHGPNHRFRESFECVIPLASIPPVTIAGWLAKPLLDFWRLRRESVRQELIFRGGATSFLRDA